MGFLYREMDGGLDLEQPLTKETCADFKNQPEPSYGVICGSRFRRTCSGRWCAVCTGITLAVLLGALLLVIFLGGHNLAQTSIDDAGIRVDSLSMTNFSAGF